MVKLERKDRMKIGNEWQLVERDLNLMRVAYEEQYLRMKTISQYFFNGSLQGASNRIRKLQSRGLVRYESLDFPGRQRVVRITQKGTLVLGAYLKFKIRQEKRVPISTFIHDSLTTEVRLSLKKIYDAEWVPEDAMKATAARKIPDGLLVFQSGTKFAVEIENTLKAKDRYQRIWREWDEQTQDAPDLVLYVASNRSLYKSLQSLMLAIQTRKVCFGLILSADLLAGNPKEVWTPKGNIPLFNIRSF